jgi:hypothetical protein
LSTARNIIRELQALGAHLARDGDRLILRAGRRPVPQHLVERARDVKREMLALLDERGAKDATLRVPREIGLSPRTKKPVASFEENCPESRENTGGSLRMPVASLGGTLRGNSASVASSAGGAIASKSEDFCESPDAGTDINQQDSRRITPTLSKDATPSESLASLENSLVFCGSQTLSSPKDATPCCRESLSPAAAQQNAYKAKSYKASGCATGGSFSGATCCECGAAIIELVVTWWGGRPCHRDCGEAAFRQIARADTDAGIY